MKEVLKFLEKQIDEGDYYKYHLNGPANDKDLKELDFFIEDMPDGYRDFLSAHNGGFICSGIMAEYIWECEGDSDYSAEERVREDSLNILKAEEVIDGLFCVQYMIKDIEDNEIESESAFVIAENSGRSVIMQKKKNSPVFMLYLDLDDEKWKIKKLYSDFRSFLYDYVKNDGYIEGIK